MRNIKIMIILFLLFGFASVYAQQTSCATDKTVTKSSNEMVDPKLSPEEQSEMLNAGQDNPAKIDESLLVDPKMDPAELPTEADYGPSNAKPEPTEEREMVEAPIVKTTAAKADTQTKNIQPKGEQSGLVVNYRNMNGPNNQPKAKKAGKVTNYREMNGSNSQPLPATKKDPIKLN